MNIYMIILKFILKVMRLWDAIPYCSPQYLKFFLVNISVLAVGIDALGVNDHVGFKCLYALADEDI